MLLTNPAYLFILVWTIWTAILKYNMYLDPIPNQLTRWNTSPINVDTFQLIKQSTVSDRYRYSLKVMLAI